MFRNLLLHLIATVFMAAPNEATAQQVTGEYRLRGNHEMVATFRFSNDSSFEFYFIYGAVDRMAKGKYTVEDSKVILHADKVPGQDFRIKEKKISGEGTTVKITDKNVALQRGVLCLFIKGKEQEAVYSDQKGIAHTAWKGVDSILALHTLFPDVFTIIKAGSQERENFFEITLNPSLAELSFHEFVLNIEGDTLTGSLPYIFESERSIFTKNKD